MEAKRTALFTTLPPEMVTRILFSVTELDTLANAALSSRALYRAFKVNEKRLVHGLLIDHIGRDVLPDAVLAYTCTPPGLKPDNVRAMTASRNISMATWWTRCAEEFVRKATRPELASLNLNLAKAFDLERTHRYVAAFTEKFIRRCANTDHDLALSCLRLPLSYTEKVRIARALYLFDTCCTLFGCMNPMDVAEVVHFLRKYEPWEIAQLGIIHDFLAREAIPVFAGVATEAAKRGKDSFGVGFGIDCDPDCNWIQYTLSLGLEQLHTFVTAETNAERTAILLPRKKSGATHSTFLCAALDQSNYVDPAIGIPAQKVSYDDKDAGPKQFWEHSRKGRGYSLCTYELLDWKYRSWGYAMWDSARLEHLGALKTPWDEATDPEVWPVISWEDEKRGVEREWEEIDRLRDEADLWDLGWYSKE